MKFLFKILIFSMIFFIVFLAFLPKEKLYNLAEKKLALQNIVISNEERKDNIFSLDLNNIEVYYDGINTALIKKSKISTFLFLSNIEFYDIRISNSLKNMFPNKIKNLELRHSFLDYDKVSILSEGDFGQFEGQFLIFESKIVGELKPSNIMKSKYRNILKQFKLKEGRYYYEYKL